MKMFRQSRSNHGWGFSFRDEQATNADLAGQSCSVVHEFVSSSYTRAGSGH